MKLRTLAKGLTFLVGACIALLGVAWVLQQLARLAVGERVAAHVEHRVAQTGGEQRVADVVHVEEAAHVRLLVDLRAYIQFSIFLS